MGNIKIREIADDYILFSDFSMISYDHCQDCCEENYADFKQLDDEAKNYLFIEPLIIERVEGSGFRFGDKYRMFFVPCYSMQNGYYSSDLDIYYSQRTLMFNIPECEMQVLE